MAENTPKSNPWSSLSTVNTFDKGNHSWSTRVVDETEMQGSGQIVGRVAQSTSLLIESLIKQLCTMFEGDADKRTKLYLAICDRLHEMKLIDNSYNLIEFDIMRGQYQIALCKLVTVARASTGSEAPLQAPNCLTAEWSRYLREFKEIEFIDAGGFGNVYKALHRLDGHEYAIKKIVVRSDRVNTIMKHLEEVKTIARLNHTNIVSYKGAWIEPTLPVTLVPSFAKPESSGENSANYVSQRKSSESPRSEIDRSLDTNNSESFTRFTCKNSFCVSVDERCRNTSSSSSNSNSNGDFVTISHKVKNERLKRSNPTTNIVGERISDKSNCRTNDEGLSDSVSFRNDTRESKICEGTISASEDVDESNSRDVSEHRIVRWNSLTRRRYATLYIQMTLCDQTLRQWIDERPEPPSILLVGAIINQILSGLEYIHSCGIVHHDIKPKNIFISASGNLQVQLGDFGLACPLQRETHHSGLGTPTYAAPEQLNGDCDPKSDVYSLGIVLLELLVPMKTHMERSRVIEGLRAGQIPTSLATEHPKWAQIISQLVQIDPKNRPTPTQLLQNLSEDKDSLISKLRDENVKKDDEIRDLREKIAQLEEQLEQSQK